MARYTDPRPSEDHIRRSHELVRTLLPALREIARSHGYALAVHGSLERDIDLVAIPWREHATDPTSLLRAFYDLCKLVVGATWPAAWTEDADFKPPPGSLPNPEKKPHGRLAWTIHVHGPYFDISVMPRVEGKSDLLEKARALQAKLPPEPWEADIDDPGTPGEDFTGKFCHPEFGDEGRVATALYDEPGLARDIAELRNMFPELIQALESK